MTTHTPSFTLSSDVHPRRRRLSKETGKTLYEGPDAGKRVLYFEDDMAIDGRVLSVSGKGVFNNRISDILMSRLNQVGIETHFIRILNMREQLVHTTETLPFSITIHNVTADDFAKKLGLQEGLLLPKPIPEFFLRSSELGNPVVTAEHLTALGWCRFEEVDDILLASQRINDFLNGQFLMANIRLFSITLEFGRCYASNLTEPQIMLTDEISPDTCSLLDLKTGKRLDRHGVQDKPEQVLEIYQEVARRLGVLGLDLPSKKLSSQGAGAAELAYKQILIKRRKKPHGHNSR